MNNRIKVYEDKNYIIINKHGEIEGTLLDAIEIAVIGIAGMKYCKDVFQKDEDFKKIRNELIEELKKL